MPSAATTPSSTSAPCAYVQELRLAVVMYGGVSLAIYMNGVAQELLRLVRASAPACGSGRGQPSAHVPEHALRGSERAYRRLARILGADGDWRALAADPAAPLRTRVVIDILAGTSAGGINAVFLAKALANDQDMDRLRGLWLRKGDLDRLLDRSRRPESLLDGAQMLGDLLEAFDAMDADRAPAARSPYVDELDLHVTATDIRGRSEALPLGETAASERRHRQVFRFSYATAQAVGDDANDFAWRDNPLLAFAARCTSSFPVAFPPARFDDLGAATAGRIPDAARLRRLFRCWNDGDPAAAVCARAFGDGGYLDNKPFSQATATLARRRADLPVVRRLIYVEPVPEHPELATDAQGRPDAFENAAAALLTLPRYETIREDLAAVVERNRLIERVAALTRGIEQDVAQRPSAAAQVGAKAAPDATAQDWRTQDLRDQIGAYGAPYGVYHRLKVQALLDDLALLLARLVGVEEGGPEHDGLRRLAVRWARLGYAEFRELVPPGGATENQLLLAFDLGYRLRRLEFLGRMVGDLQRPGTDDAQRRRMLAAAGLDEAPVGEDLAAFHAALAAVRVDLNDVAMELRRTRRALRDPATSPLAPLVRGLRELAPGLAALGRAAPSARSAREDELWATVGSGVGALVAALEAQLRPAFERASVRLRELLDPSQRDGDGRWDRLARAYLWHFYRYFDHFDLILFPITYGTAIGEATPVELVRIAPEDATTLIDERCDPCGRRKLAGTALGNFGAFLDAGWRRNDLLWGRLDAAERLIRSALPDQPEAAEALLVEAHEAILAEELLPAEGDELCRLLAQALVRIGVEPGRTGARDLAALVERDCGVPLGARLEALLRRCLDAPTLREHLARAYEVDRRLEPAVAMRLAARSAEVAGRLLAVLGERHRGASLVAPWLIRIGRFAWGFLELALPGRSANLIARHWLHLLYLLELILILGGLLAGAPAIQDFGAKALVLTAGAHLVLSVVGTLLSRRPGRGIPWGRIAGWTAAGLGLAVLALALSGVAVRLTRWVDLAAGWWAR